MKKLYFTLVASIVAFMAIAQGWPGNYSGVMLQGFYWDSYDVTNWKKFSEPQRANELCNAFDLIWIPNSATVQGNGESMGYMPFAWLRHSSQFGTEAELLSMIDLYRGKGTGFIEDVVINHKAASRADDGTYRKFYVENKDGYVLDWDNTTFTGITSNDRRRLRRRPRPGPHQRPGAEKLHHLSAVPHAVHRLCGLPPRHGQGLRRTVHRHVQRRQQPRLQRG